MEFVGSKSVAMIEICRADATCKGVTCSSAKGSAPASRAGETVGSISLMSSHWYLKPVAEKSNLFDNDLQGIDG